MNRKSIPTLARNQLTEVRKIGRITNAEVIQQFLSLDGKHVLDAGCGNLGFTRDLTIMGASVLAIDPDAVQAELNRKAGPVENIEFVETGAEKIPCGDGAVDGICLLYTSPSPRD